MSSFAICVQRALLLSSEMLDEIGGLADDLLVATQLRARKLPKPESVAGQKDSSSRAPRGLPVDGGVAHQCCVVRTDACAGAEMREAGRIGFPRKRTVAANHRVVREEPGQAKACEDATGRAARLVRENRQRGLFAQRIQR